MEEKNKLTILALSLAVLTLASVSALLSVGKPSVLGETSLIQSRPAIKQEVRQIMPERPITPPVAKAIPCATIEKVLSGLCGYAIPLNQPNGPDIVRQNVLGEAVNGDVNPGLTAPSETKPGMGAWTTGPTGIVKRIAPSPIIDRNAVCNTIMTLFKQHCTTGALPTPPCAVGVKVFTVGQPCNTASNAFSGAKYACQDGFTGVIGTSTSSETAKCLPYAELKAQAEKACSGRSSCRPEDIKKGCTSDKDCPTSYRCLIQSTAMYESGDQSVKTGVCVPNTKVSVTPVPPTKTSCQWCGTSCIRVTAGQACTMIAPPANQKCMEVAGTCTIIKLTDSNKPTATPKVRNEIPVETE